MTFRGAAEKERKKKKRKQGSLLLYIYAFFFFFAQWREKGCLSMRDCREATFFNFFFFSFLAKR